MADQSMTVSKERVLKLLGLLSAHDRHLVETWTSRLWQQTAEQGCCALRSASPLQESHFRQLASATSTTGTCSRCTGRTEARCNQPCGQASGRLHAKNPQNRLETLESG